MIKIIPTNNPNAGKYKSYGSGAYYRHYFRVNTNGYLFNVLMYLLKNGPSRKSEILKNVWGCPDEYIERPRHDKYGSSKPWAGYNSLSFATWNMNNVIVYNSSTKNWEIGDFGRTIITAFTYK